MSATPSSFARIRALPAAERRVFLSALLLLPIAGICVRLLGLRAAHGLFDWAPARGACSGAVDPARVASIVAALARRTRSKCLAASLVLRLLLWRAGHESRLRIGVRKRAARLEAHAWVELDSVPLLPTGDEHGPFAAFDEAIAFGRRAP